MGAGGRHANQPTTTNHKTLKILNNMSQGSGVVCSRPHGLYDHIEREGPITQARRKNARERLDEP